MLKWIKKLGIQLFEEGNGSKSVDKSETSFSMARIMHSARKAGVSTETLLIFIGLANKFMEQLINK